MKKWTVDADDVRDIGEELFYETPWISDFLAPDNTSRLLLVGTKGFGKTLLLLAKRLRFERARSSFHLEAVRKRCCASKPGNIDLTPI